MISRLGILEKACLSFFFNITRHNQSCNEKGFDILNETSRHDLFLVSWCQNEQELNNHDPNFQLKGNMNSW